MDIILIGLIIFVSILIFVVVHKLFNIVYFSIKGFLTEIIMIIIISTFSSIIILGKIGDIFDNNKKDVEVNNIEYDSIDKNIDTGNNLDTDKKTDIDIEVENKIESFHNKIKSGNANINDLVEFNSGGYNAFSATEFQDNVAWVEDVGNYYCIDTTGKILFFLEKNKFNNSISVTNFSNGISVINNSYVINKSGEIISSTEYGDYDEIILQGEYLDTIYNGLVFVEKKIETFDKNETLIGIIGNDGKFKRELSDKIKFADYIGDGLYHVSNDNNEKMYLDSKDMKIYTSSELNLFNEDYIVGGINYRDGQELFFSKGYGMTDDEYKGVGFYNKAGEKILDLSEYNNIDKEITNHPYFTGEHCVLVIVKRDNSKWITVINKLGERLFEPIKLNDGEEVGEISKDLIRISYLNARSHYFINISGEIVINTINANSVTDFNDGLSMVKTDNGYYYINTKGDKVLSLEQNKQ